MPAPSARSKELIRKSYFQSKPYFHSVCGCDYAKQWLCVMFGLILWGIPALRLQRIIPLLSYLCKLISWILLLPAYCCCLCPVVSAAVQSEGQSTLSAPSTDYWFFCTTRFNERPIAQCLSFTHTRARTHTHIHRSKSACHNSWYLSRRAVTLTDAEGASAPRPGLMYIKGNAWLVLAPDFSRIQTMSRGFARKT